MFLVSLVSNLTQPVAKRGSLGAFRFSRLWELPDGPGEQDCPQPSNSRATKCPCWLH